MRETYWVRVTKDSLVFSAAHFITYHGNVCERLHGHNYRVTADVFGPLDENQYVVDFVALREALRDIVLELDHYVLLPTSHPTIRVVADDQSVEATFEDRRWVFPRGDCVLLPVSNTTAELLARHIGRQLLGRLEKLAATRPEKLRIAVDECEGQVGVCELTPE